MMIIYEMVDNPFAIKAFFYFLSEMESNYEAKTIKWKLVLLCVRSNFNDFVSSFNSFGF